MGAVFITIDRARKCRYGRPLAAIALNEQVASRCLPTVKFVSNQRSSKAVGDPLSLLLPTRADARRSRVIHNGLNRLQVEMEAFQYV
jgi:hypothetical protein